MVVHGRALCSQEPLLPGQLLQSTLLTSTAGPQRAEPAVRLDPALGLFQPFPAPAMWSSVCASPAGTKQRCYGNHKHQATWPCTWQPSRGRDNGFCCYPLDTLLSPLCPQALTGAALTAASALSGDVPSLMMLLITSMARLAHYPDGHLGPRASLTTSVGSPPSGDPGLSTHLLSSDSPSPTGWPVLPPVFLSFSQHC